MVTLTGEPGTGKTTVLKAVLASISAASIKASYVCVPTLTTAEFLELVLLQFGLLSLARANKAERLIMFERFLLSMHAKNKTVVLIVDEAHKLSGEILEEIRLLTNFETSEGKLIQIVLAGQSDLEDLLRQDEMSQFKQRVSYRFSLKGLTESEVAGYIAHRWARAGGSSAPPFDEDAIRGVALYSQGIPRLINSICDNALVMAFGDGVRAVRAATVLEAARDLDLLNGHHRESLNGHGENGSGLQDLDLLVSASTLADSRFSAAIERGGAPRKEPWLARSTRKLLGARAAEA
jgi:general secretion pathway protein A